MITNIENISVVNCPHCNKLHNHKVLIKFIEKRNAPFFAGNTEHSITKNNSEMFMFTLKCPVTNLVFLKEILVDIPSDAAVNSIEEVLPDSLLTQENISPLENEIKERKQKSIETIRSFSEKLINFNLACLGLIVTLLTFLSAENKIQNSVVIVILFSISCSFFLVSLVLSVIIIVPMYIKNNYDYIDRAEKWTKKQHKFLLLSLSLFVIAIVSSILLILFSALL